MRSWIRRMYSRFCCIGILLLSIFFIVRPDYSQVAGGAAENSPLAATYGKIYEAAGNSPGSRELKGSMNDVLTKAAQKARQFSQSRKSPSKVSPTQKPVSSPSPQSEPSSGVAKKADPPISDLGIAPLVAPPLDAFPPTSKLFFKPDPDLDTVGPIIDTWPMDDQTKEYTKGLFKAAKYDFENEMENRGRKNNIAEAYTFFVTEAVTTYHGDPMPSQAAIDDLASGLSIVLEEFPGTAKATDRDKQEIYDAMILYGGMLKAERIYLEKNNNPSLRENARKLAALTLSDVFKRSPDGIRFINDSLVIAN